MQQNKRKNRGGSVRGPRPKPEGVYNNAHFMHAATSQVGNVVRIKTASGSVWEGVFKTFSSNFDVVIEVAAKVENPDSPNSQIQADTYVDKLIFKACDILTMVARDVDLEYPTRDTFQTDTAISARLNGTSKLEERELEPWDPTDESSAIANGLDSSLDLDPGANGWDADDMFRTNEQEYGVQTTYDHSLRQYTVPLVKREDSPEYKEDEKRAEKIAMEIENQPASRSRAELEDMDEEAAYASVQRPPQREQDPASINGKYIPPSKRKNQNVGKLVRSTPPPSQSSSNQNTPSPKDTRPPMSYSSHPAPHQNNVHTQQQVPQNQHPMQQQPPPQPQPHNMHNHVPPVHSPQANIVQHQMPQQVLPPPQQQPPPPQQPHSVPNHHHGGRPHHSHTPPHHQQQYQPSAGQARQQQHAPNKQPQMNGEGKGAPNGPPQRMHRYANQQYRGSNVPNEPPEPKQREERHHHHGREEAVVKDLHNFAQDFKLAPMAQQPPPQPSPQQIESPPQSQVQVVPPPVIPEQVPPQQQQQVPVIPPTNKPPPVPPQQTTSPPHPQQALSPQQDPNMEKVANTLKNSKLNPNAKEFILNPTAKPFQPSAVFRSPSTPSASRPHTPQTPSHSPYIPATVSGPGVQQQVPIMMSLYPMMTSQPQYQPPPQPQPNRIKRLPMSGMRADMASQMQVAAATGQPLLAPAPLQQFIYQPSAVAMNQAAAAAVAAAAYQPVHHAAVRMYEAAAAGGPPPHQHQPPPQATQIQYLPHQPPHQSQTPSPAQHQQPPPPPQYNPAQGGPPQPGPPHQQQQQCAAAPPPQVDTSNFYGHPQFPLMYPIIPQAHMMQGMQYLQQAPPPQHPQHHPQHPIPIMMHHPAQAHGPNP